MIEVADIVKMLLTGVLSFSGALLAVWLGHKLTTERKRKDELAEMRLKAYTDFINAASRLVAARRIGQTTDELDDLCALNDAKTRICICAEASVVEALADFWSHGGTLEKEEEILAFTRLCLQIRESLGNERHDLQKRDLRISDLLFKLEPSAYSFRGDRKKPSGQTTES